MVYRWNPFTNNLDDVGTSNGPIPPFITSDQNVYVSAQTGSDTTGTGSAINPYATITHALGTITDNAITKPYAIKFEGVSTENVAIKPFVSLIGTGIENSVVNGNLTTAASWNGVDDAGTTIKDIGFTAMAISMTGIANVGIFHIVGCQFLNASTFTGNGNNQTLNLNRCLFDSTITFTDVVYHGFTNTFFGAVTLTTASAPGSITNRATGELFLSTVAMTNPAGHVFLLNLVGCSVTSSLSVTASAVNFDSVSYPQSGFTFASAGVATARISAPLRIPSTSVTGATYTLVGSDYYLACNRAGAIALTFPTATGSGRTIIVKDVSGAAAANNITATSSGATFDGVVTLTINTNYGSVICTDTATNVWSIS